MGGAAAPGDFGQDNLMRDLVAARASHHVMPNFVHFIVHFDPWLCF